MNSYDVLIKNGRVIDPANNVDGRFDVAISGGRIAEVAAGIRLAEENKRRAVLLLVNRNGQKRYVALPLPKA